MVGSIFNVGEYIVKDLKKFISCLKSTINKVNEEKNKSELWTNELLILIESECLELLEHAEKNEIFFKYGTKNRMLQSTYYMLDSLSHLDSTELGRSISALQQEYNKL